MITVGAVFEPGLLSSRMEREMFLMGDGDGMEDGVDAGHKRTRDGDPDATDVENLSDSDSDEKQSKFKRHGGAEEDNVYSLENTDEEEESSEEEEEENNEEEEEGVVQDAQQKKGESDRPPMLEPDSDTAHPLTRSNKRKNPQ